MTLRNIKSQPVLFVRRGDTPNAAVELEFGSFHDIFFLTTY